MARLTSKRKIFIEEYLRCWNGAEAARRAEYKHPRQQASYLLTIPNIQEAIKERIAEKIMSADEVLVRLGEQARSEQTAYLNTDGTIDLEKLIEDGKAHLVKGTKWDKDGNLIVEFYDAQSALVHVGKHCRIFKDEVDLNIHGVVATSEASMSELAKMDDDELDQYIANLEAIQAALGTGEKGAPETPGTAGSESDTA